MDSSTPIGVIGAGTMGAGIAQVAASAGHTVHLHDNFPGALDKAKELLERVHARLVEKGKLDDAEASARLNRIRFDADLEAVGECGMVIEAVVEDATVKRDVFTSLEARVASDAILATNTSSLSIASIASACESPQRVIGVHFFNPAPLLPLVEIVPGIHTDKAVTTTARALVDGWGKTTVVAKDTPGFIVNRVARPFYGEALRILDEGIADVATIDHAMKTAAGFRMGPFELMDLIGNDVNYAVTETVFAAFSYDARYRPSFTQKRLVEAGLLGRKAGRGFYEYGDGAAVPAADTNAESARAIADRVVAMLINEAADAVFWGVASPEDIDLAMTRGVNYPKGLLAWCDELGAGTVVGRIDALADRYREDRYRTSPLLREMASEGKTFF